MKVAVVQTTSGSDLEANLRKMEKWVGEAAAAGASLVALPEMAYFTGPRESWVPLLPAYERLVETFSGWAKRHRIYLLPGTVREPVAGTADRCHNTALFFSPDGESAALYRKIFLFKARLPDRDYDEAGYCEPGNALAVAQAGELKVGLSICYDLRFPELFRSLRKREAQLILLPAAFTVPTGRAHWDCLTRARAVENGCFLAAPAQWGVMGDGARTYGRSRILSPWGDVLVEIPEGEGMAVAPLERAALDEARAKVDAWGGRREDRFPIA